MESQENNQLASLKILIEGIKIAQKKEHTLWKNHQIYGML